MDDANVPRYEMLEGVVGESADSREFLLQLQLVRQYAIDETIVGKGNPETLEIVLSSELAERLAENLAYLTGLLHQSSEPPSGIIESDEQI